MKKEYEPFVDELDRTGDQGEDIGDGDHTTPAAYRATSGGRMRLLCKQEGVLAGVEIARRVFRRLDPEVRFEQLLEDGARVRPGDVAFYVEGQAPHPVAAAERIVLKTSCSA